jgi:hypothetical protein
MTLSPDPLLDYRSRLYGSFTRWGDALFELCDAVLCSTAPVHSVPSLSLEPEFSRSHGSLYKALARGRIDEDALRALLVTSRPSAWPLVFAVDASTWARCDAETSPERGFHYSASHHSAGQPIVAGWSYQWISQLNWAKDSWTAPLDALRITPAMDATGATIDQVKRLDVLRISPAMDATTTTIDQVKRLCGRLPADREVPLFVFDAGYDGVALADALDKVRAEVLVRISSSRVFHPDPAPRGDGARGRPARHGARFVLADQATWTPPTDELVLDDPSYGAVRVQAWRGLHPKLHGRGRWKGQGEPPIVRGTVIRVEVEHLPKPCGRADKTLWLWCVSRHVIPYLRRMSVK